MLQVTVSTVVIVVMLASVPAPAMSAEKESTPAKLTIGELRELRRQAANRSRRIIYNDDGCHGPSRETPEQLINCRVRQVTKTQVDTISYCTGGGGVFWAHQPKVGEVLGAWVEENHGAYVKQMRDGLIAMKKQGTDPLEVVVDHGHRNSMEVFWSYRMNNPECSFATWGLSKRKRENRPTSWG